MPNYDKTVIYKLINYDYPDLVYVGSTTNFTKRKQHHKEGCLNLNCKKHHNKLYNTIRENGGWESWNMVKLCDYPCNNRREGEQEEDRYMILLKSNLNMRRTFQTPDTRKEYFDNRKDIKKEYDKVRRTEKAEEIKAMKREAYQRDKEKMSVTITCDCGSSVQTCYKKRHDKSVKHINYLNSLASS